MSSLSAAAQLTFSLSHVDAWIGAYFVVDTLIVLCCIVEVLNVTKHWQVDGIEYVGKSGGPALASVCDSHSQLFSVSVFCSAITESSISLTRTTIV